MLTRIRDTVRRRLRARIWRLIEGQVTCAVDQSSPATPSAADDVLSSRRIASRALPRKRSGALITVPGIVEHKPHVLPLPPEELWAVHADYIAFGERDAGILRRLCADHGLEVTGSLRVLDFGCGTGRVLRHLIDLTDEGEVWGADVDSARIDWCRANLTPPFRFLTLNTAPHLPFEDNYFDLIIGGSVFTHIIDQDDSWLLELRRVARPGALLCLSVMDQDMIASVQSEGGDTPYKDWFHADLVIEHDLDATFNDGVEALQNGAGMFAVGDDSFVPNVFHDREYLRKHWGSLLEWVTVEERAWFKQAVVILRKPLPAIRSPFVGPNIERT